MDRAFSYRTGKNILDMIDSIIVNAIKTALSGDGIITVTDEEAESAIRKAERHGVGALVCYGLEKGGYSSEKTFFVIMEELRRHTLFDAERIRMENILSENGIDYMLLKGTVVQDWYPESHLRHMADTDMLIREKDREKVRKVFENEGYTTAVYDRSQHDIYRKDPVYNYEMHVNLFHESTGNKWYKYYADVWNRLVLLNGSHRYCFVDRDMYVYLITHGIGHFLSSGTGIRTLVDLYITDRHYGLFDDDYVIGEFRNLGIYDEASLLVNTVNKLFGEDAPEYTEDEKMLIDKVFSSSLYGTSRENITQKLTDRGTHDISIMSKFKYVFNRVFPPMYTMKFLFPIMKKYPWLYPFMVLWRLIRQPFRDMGKVVRELKTLKRIK